MLKMRKKVFGLVVALTMFFGLSVTAMAAETLEPVALDGLHDGRIVLSESQANETLSSGTDSPLFYSGKVYGYNPITGDKKPVGESYWTWGTRQPGYIEVLKNDYWDLNAEGGYDWMFEYTWNSKDCTYLKIYDTSNQVYIDRSVKPNTKYTITFYADVHLSQVKLRCDYTLPGVMTVRNMQIGGLNVLY